MKQESHDFSRVECQIPHLTRYAYLKGAGYCVLHIDADGISNEFRSIKTGDTPQISIIR